MHRPFARLAFQPSPTARKNPARDSASPTHKAAAEEIYIALDDTLLLFALHLSSQEPDRPIRLVLQLFPEQWLTVLLLLLPMLLPAVLVSW
jgi:hypothetical protein